MRTLAYQAGKVGLAGAFSYFLYDAVNDVVTYNKLKSMAMKVAHEHSGLSAQLGTPFTPGPWWHSSVSFTHGGHIANATINLHGSQSSTEMAVRAVRRTFPYGTLAYNVLGPGEWKVLALDVLVPAGGGLPRSVSLLDTQQQLDLEPQSLQLPSDCPT